MSTDVTQPVRVVDPLTGEAVTLDAPTDDLARFIANVRETKSLLAEAEGIVSRELVRRMDAGACWTVHASGVKLSAPSPAPVEEIDAEALYRDLIALPRDQLALEAIDAAVELVPVQYKARKAGITKLRKLGGLVADIVDQHVTKVPRASRNLKVERS